MFQELCYQARTSLAYGWLALTVGDELRSLIRTYPGDAAIPSWLAGGMHDTVKDAIERDDLARVDAMLDELRALVIEYPDDPAVRGCWLKACTTFSMTLGQRRISPTARPCWT
jgi:hypothetical protein